MDMLKGNEKGKLKTVNQALAAENELLKKQLAELQQSKPSVAESATLSDAEALQAEVAELRSLLETTTIKSQEVIESLKAQHRIELEEARKPATSSDSISVEEHQRLMQEQNEILVELRLQIETLTRELLEASTAKKPEDVAAADGVNVEEVEQLRLNATQMTEKLKSTNLELTKLAGIIEEHEATIRSQNETIAQLKKPQKTASKAANVTVTMADVERAAFQQQIQDLTSALASTQLESNNKTERLSEQDIEQSAARKEIASLKLQLEELTRLQSNAKPSEVYPVFFADAKARQERATQAINSLLEAKSKSAKPTATDKALDGIVETLTAGIQATNPQNYFDGNKDVLKKHISTLQYTMKSFVNTAVNAILTVLAVCSVVGITALWLTGTLQSNLQKNGSSFAFTTFGHKQKVERAMHELDNAMGMGMKKGG